MARAVMVQGTTSDAGKSFLVTALCRYAARRGVRVAPFKAQNMSNNARVVDGGELGTAQWLQARAAGVTPDIRMNPVLLKPESDTRSQVVLNGRADHSLTTSPWRGRSAQLWPHVEAAYHSLADDYDLVIIEGAGSPAETNLWDDDIVNMRVADLADASVALVADIDRGGAFAHLYGTWALLPPQWRGRINGFVLNKFRGDARLLDPAPAQLAARTGIPVIGVVPMTSHALPDEEGITPIGGVVGVTAPTVRIVCGPYASNLDEFAALQTVANVEFVTSDRELAGADLVVLPGSKHVARDLAWMRAQRIDRRVIAAAQQGTPVLGICGGLQMLGQRVCDPHGVEGDALGLGVLPIETEYQPDKAVRHTRASFGQIPAPWEWLSGREIHGYEIRHGRSSSGGDDLTYVQDNVVGTYLHGLFEDAALLTAFAGAAAAPLDATFDSLADLVAEHLDPRWLGELISAAG